jgi:hypothetical protein
MIRKILSKEEMEKKDHKNKVIMSVVLAVIMLFSTAGYFVMDFSSSKQNTITYNNVDFTKNDYGLWAFSLNGNTYQTIFNPQETENVSANIGATIYQYSNQPLYFSAEPIEDIPDYASQEIIQGIGNFIARVNYACLEDNCTRDYAIKNCSIDNVIIFKESEFNRTKITQEEKCVKIEYSAGEAERASDAFLFKILGV